jgi:hypothetical protein
VTSVTILLHQPTTRNNCENAFWPFASASFRIYCAQAAADQQDLEKLLWAIRLLNELPQDHPLRPDIDRRIEDWATKVLDLAEITFQKGDLARAMQFAEQIPEQTSAYPLVEGRVARWQEIWDEGDIIYRRSVAALGDEDWRKAFAISLGLMEINNKYWSDLQFQKLNQRIVIAQKDAAKVGQVKRLIAVGGLDNLKQSLDILAELPPSSDFLKSASSLRNKIGGELLEIAVAALANEDLTTALAAAERVPSGTPRWAAAQDMITLAKADALAMSDLPSDLQQAMQMAQGIGVDRPMHLLAKERMFAWLSDMHGLQVLQQAQQKAQPGDMRSLEAAIQIARQMPATLSGFRQRMVEQQIGVWESRFLVLQDQPILDQARQLAERGSPESLQEAMRVAAQIPAAHPLQFDARLLIAEWQAKLVNLTQPPDAQVGGSQALLAQASDLAAQGTPAALAEAIVTANQVSADSSRRAEADALMTEWSKMILDLAQRQAVSSYEQAIAIAQQVPPVSSLYNDAQAMIRDWQAQL